jgi:hypothetical protein
MNRQLFSSILLLLSLFVFNSAASAQNTGIGIGTATPHPSAAFEVADSSRGILIPRMTMAQRNAIQNPAEGLMVYQTDSTFGNWIFSRNEWVNYQPSNSIVLSNSGNMNLVNGFTITDGTFQPSVGKKWKIESINLLNDSYSYNLSADFISCSQGTNFWTGAPQYYCNWHFEGIQLSVLKVGSVKVVVSVPSSDPREGPFMGTCGCSGLPLQFVHTITSSVFDRV